MIVNTRCFSVTQIWKILFLLIWKLFIWSRTLGNIKCVWIGCQTLIVLQSDSLFLYKVILYFHLLSVFVFILNSYFLAKLISWVVLLFSYVLTLSLVQNLGIAVFWFTNEVYSLERFKSFLLLGVFTNFLVVRSWSAVHVSSQRSLFWWYFYLFFRTHFPAIQLLVIFLILKLKRLRLL